MSNESDGYTIMSRSTLYYTEATRRAKEQEETRKHFDSMATTILGFSALLIGLLPFAVSKWSVWIGYPMVTTIIAFLGVSVSTIYSLWLRRWEFQPPLDTLYKHMESLEYGDEALVLWSARWIADAVSNNKAVVNTKAICLKFAYVFLSIEVLSLIITFHFALGVA